MGTKNQMAVYEWVNISDDLVYEWVRFFKGQGYEWGRFRNTSSHTRTNITPKLPPPPPYPSPPPPHPAPASRCPSSVVRRQQFLQIASPLKPLGQFQNNLTQMFLLRPFTKIAKMVSLH